MIKAGFRNMENRLFAWSKHGIGKLHQCRCPAPLMQKKLPNVSAAAGSETSPGSLNYFVTRLTISSTFALVNLLPPTAMILTVA
ncbi:hypothetical protein PAECIP111802_00348 [Paenibacillus allorhizosphaerae]|uniref:Uncharacterized protein n=1 Tax=Paenibacillus allorhizosphaerae TaxID=2849866 RepID=A0ABM8VAV7_9BACL|nr:hypothetical protein PAECIP111802_00348 [Paenibacillus allorhizosphaerae]